MKKDKSILTNILLALVLIVGIALLYLSVTDTPVPGNDILKENEATIEGLRADMEARERSRDSIIAERLSDLKRLQQLKQNQTRIVYDYHKDMANISTLPADGVYRQLANDIAADYSD